MNANLFVHLIKLRSGVGIAMHVGFGNLGGAIGAFLFQVRTSLCSDDN